jgi:hypothetical protein
VDFSSVRYLWHVAAPCPAWAKQGFIDLLGPERVLEMWAAAIDEARKLDMRTTMHHDQTSVTRMNVLDSARLGLDSMEHWYGLPEAMFDDKQVQDYPLDYNYSNEQDRFGEAGRLWLQAAEPGSDTWSATIDELLALDFTLAPTLTIYEASRDVERARLAEWHAEYTMPYIMRAFEPDPKVHGSYFFDWTTAHEVAWKHNYQRWMRFLNDYKNAGGRVTAGSDAGYIYKLYGFLLYPRAGTAAGSGLPPAGSAVSGNAERRRATGHGGRDWHRPGRQEGRPGVGGRQSGGQF